jgi:4-hydroxy-tetrahydrodipicolinate reductase
VALRVIMSGVTGRTGREVALALERAEDVRLVAAVGRASAGRRLADLLGVREDDRLVFPDLEAAYAAAGGADVWVDFTHAEATEAMLPQAARLGLKGVVGTSGLSAAALRRAEDDVRRFGGALAVVANFSLGAYLLEELAKIAYRRIGHAEIVEMHSAHKRDKPSATALRLKAELGGDVPVHSVRLPGLVAHQEVILAHEGEVLTLRHDVLSRTAYAEGVLAAVRAIAGRRGFFRSLAELIRAPAEGERP